MELCCVTNVLVREIRRIWPSQRTATWVVQNSLANSTVTSLFCNVRRRTMRPSTHSPIPATSFIRGHQSIIPPPFFVVRCFDRTLYWWNLVFPSARTWHVGCFETYARAAARASQGVHTYIHRFVPVAARSSSRTVPPVGKNSHKNLSNRYLTEPLIQ